MSILYNPFLIKIASMKKGHKFAIATKGCVKIFKLIDVKKNLPNGAEFKFMGIDEAEVATNTRAIGSEIKP